MERSYELELMEISEIDRTLEVDLVVNGLTGNPLFGAFDVDNLFIDPLSRLYQDVDETFPSTFSEGQILYSGDGTPVELSHDYECDSFRPIGGLFEWTNIFSYRRAKIIYTEVGRGGAFNHRSSDFEYTETNTPAGKMFFPNLPASWATSGWNRRSVPILVQSPFGQYFYVHYQAWGIVAHRSLAELQEFKSWLSESSPERLYFLNNVFSSMEVFSGEDIPPQMEYWGACLGVEAGGWLDFIAAVKAGTGLNFNISRRPIFWYPFLSGDTKASVSQWVASIGGDIGISVYCRDFPDNFWTVSEESRPAPALGLLFPLPDLNLNTKENMEIRGGNLTLSPFGTRRTKFP